MVNWYEDTRYQDPGSGITGWGFLPNAEQQAVRDEVFLMDLTIQGFSLAAVLPTRAVNERVNWRCGDPEVYLETHWQLFRPGYASVEDEQIATSTLETIERLREGHEVVCIEPTTQMKLDMGIQDDLPEGHGLVAVMIRSTDNSNST